MKNFKFYQLSETQITWLKSYYPKNSMFTSAEEVNKIKEMLNLSDFTKNELIQIRNSIVYLYSNLIDAEYKENNNNCTDHAFYHLIPAMSSITAVIDSLKYSF